MAKRIPRHVREAAICALWSLELWVGEDEGARLAHAAFFTVGESVGFSLGADDVDVEAAALLKEGWSPGDPVVRWRRG